MKKLIGEFLDDMKAEGKSAGSLATYRYRLEDIANYYESKNIDVLKDKSVKVSSYIKTLRQKCQKLRQFEQNYQFFGYFVYGQSRRAICQKQ